MKIFMDEKKNKENLEKIVVKHKQTKWIPMNLKDEKYDKVFKCRFCGNIIIGASKFCPNCSHDMMDENGKIDCGELIDDIFY